MKARGFPEEARREQERVCQGRGGCGGAVGLLSQELANTEGCQMEAVAPRQRWPGREVPLPSGGKDSTQLTLWPQNHEFPWCGGVCSREGEGSKGQGPTRGRRK